MIVVAGEGLIDRIVQPDGSIAEVPGGGPFNVARTLGRLGLRVAFLGRMSTDARGEMLRERLASDGVDLSFARRTDSPTLIAEATIDPHGAAVYRFEPAGSAAAELLPGDVPGGLPLGITAFHVGSLGLVLEPAATTIASLVLTAAPNVVVMADPNIRPAAISNAVAYRTRLAALLARVDVVKVSVEDLAWLHPGAEAVEGARLLIAAGPAVVLLTDGARPGRLITAHGSVTIPVPEVHVIDTVGAGDAFGAGFLAAWTWAGHDRADLHRLDALTAAMRFATEVGARTATRLGADPPSLADLHGVVPEWTAPRSTTK
jgi:fructokinase